MAKERQERVLLNKFPGRIIISYLYFSFSDAGIQHERVLSRGSSPHRHPCSGRNGGHHVRVFRGILQTYFIREYIILGLLDPDLLVRDTDSDSSTIDQK